MVDIFGFDIWYKEFIVLSTIASEKLKEVNKLL